MSHTWDQSSRLHVEELELRDVPAGFSDIEFTNEFAPGRLIVTFADASGSSSDQAAQLTRVSHTQSVLPLGLGAYRVDIDPNGDADAIVREFGAIPGVAIAEGDRKVQLNRTLNDPQIPSQTALNTIRVPEAFDRATGSKNTIVAVIDTGIDYTHPDLANNIWRNPGEIPGNGIDDNGDGFIDDVYGYDFANNDSDPFDDDRHGTHVAGIIGASGNNSIGITGVNPYTRLIALKFIKADGTGFTSDAVRAINYAISHGARVINASWGGAGSDPTLAAAFGRAQSAGVIVVAAAGNDSTNNDTNAFYPANYATDYDNVISVAATDTSDRLASFSNTGFRSVTLGAPGLSILSTLPGNRYGNLSGTSQATPFVAGAIALFWDQNPTFTYRQVLDALRASVDPIPALAGRTVTGGRLNVARLVGAADSPQAAFASGAAISSAIFSGSSSTSFNRIRVSFNQAINASSFTAADVTLSGPSGAIGIANVVAVAGTNNTQFDLFFSERNTPGTYSLSIGPNILNASGQALNQNRNTVNGESSDRFTGSSSLAAPVSQSFSAFAAPGSVAIPDQRSVSIPIVVTRSGTLSNVNASVNISHTYNSDLILQLRSPSGRTITLSNRRGLDGDNYAGTTFGDLARTPIGSGAAPFRGAYNPEQTLSAFRGESVQGTWTLIVTDAAARDTGTVNAVTLDFITSNTTQTRSASTRTPSVAFINLETHGVNMNTPTPPARSTIRAESAAALGIDPFAPRTNTTTIATDTTLSASQTELQTNDDFEPFSPFARR